MTQPLGDDIVTGATKYLQAQPECLTAVDTFNISGRVVPGIFAYQLGVRMEQSQRTSVLITHDGGWAAPNIVNSMRFPRLLLSVLADPLRDGNGNARDPMLQRRANACFETFDKYLHCIGSGEMWWGSLRVLDSIRLTEPSVNSVGDGDGLIRMQAYYAITQG